MIYLDSSAALAHIFVEGRLPPAAMWRERLASSLLLEYEIWNRIFARNLAPTHISETKALLDRVTLIELSSNVLVRALEPFPAGIRTLDGLHLATIEFLRARGEDIELASYDRKLVRAAQALGIAIYPL